MPNLLCSTIIVQAKVIHLYHILLSHNYLCYTQISGLISVLDWPAGLWAWPGLGLEIKSPKWACADLYSTLSTIHFMEPL